MNKVLLLTTVAISSTIAVADVLPTVITTINSDDFTTTVTNGTKATLKEGTSLNLSNEEWSITASFVVDTTSAFNTWGTTLLCTTESLYENFYNSSSKDLQIWLNKGGTTLNVKGMGFCDNSYGASINQLTLTSGSTYTITITATQKTTGDYAMSLTLADKDGKELGSLTNQTGTTVTFTEGQTLTYVTTSIGSGSTHSSATWTKPTVVFRTPEPATATLSLLALAGLAARRRRK